MSGHTPGPWTANRRRGRASNSIDVRSATGIVANGIVGGGTGNDGEANANLIAAAPDLLAALDSAEAALEMFADPACCDGGVSHEDKCKVGQVLVAIAAAKAKARGGA